jgi:alpha-beta hydrolase superfamily lysophospholipase
VLSDLATVQTPTPRPCFIAAGPHDLFAWHHPARSDRRRNAAVILCSSLGGEHVRIYRLWRTLAQRLAALGFDAFRFDYEGTGESCGDMDEPDRPQAWLRNIETVVKEVRVVTGARDVALVGLRIGGMLALHASASCGVDRVVLWSPFRSGRNYVRELKALQRLSDDPHAAVDQDTSDILAAGYILPGPVAAALERLDLERLSTTPAADVLVVERDDRSPDPIIAERLASLGCGVTRIRPPGTGQMFEHGGIPRTPDEALDAITAWLAEWPPRGQRPIPRMAAPPARPPSAHGVSSHECCVRFGPSDRLFGILHAPNTVVNTGAAVIFLNTNYEYRVGPHRLYVPLARECAARGHVVLRYDLGGIGDSEASPGAADNVAYAARALDDVREAIAFMRRRAPARPILVAGLCSGAWHAFRAASEGLGVDAIFAVNPPLYLRDGASIEVPEIHEIGGYRRAVRDRSRWKNALHGRAAYGDVGRVFYAYAKKKAVVGIRSVLGGRQEGLARELETIDTRGIASLFVFSNGDSGHEYFRLHGRLSRFRSGSHIRHVVVDGAGHTFGPPAAQLAMRELLLDFLAQQTARP